MISAPQGVPAKPERVQQPPRNIISVRYDCCDVGILYGKLSPEPPPLRKTPQHPVLHRTRGPFTYRVGLTPSTQTYRPLNSRRKKYTTRTTDRGGRTAYCILHIACRGVRATMRPVVMPLPCSGPTLPACTRNRQSVSHGAFRERPASAVEGGGKKVTTPANSAYRLVVGHDLDLCLSVESPVPNLEISILQRHGKSGERR